MSYDAILKAALTHNETALKSALSNTSIDIWKPCEFYFSVASQLALENNIESVNFPLAQDANKSYAAYGAARSGQRDYAEFLRAEGANIIWIAEGAAQGGGETSLPEKASAL